MKFHEIRTLAAVLTTLARSSLAPEDRAFFPLWSRSAVGTLGRGDRWAESGSSLFDLPVWRHDAPERRHDLVESPPCPTKRGACASGANATCNGGNWQCGYATSYEAVVYRTGFHGENELPFPKESDSNPVLAAVDPAANKVYWATRSNIHRASLDGTGVEVMGSTPPTNAFALYLCP